MMSENEKIAKAFADQFVPPLKYVQTTRVNNVPMKDAWSISYWDNNRSLGITAVVFAGQIHAYIECAGPGDLAEEAGRVIATALGLIEGGLNGAGH